MKKILFPITLCLAAFFVFISCDEPDLYTVDIPVHVTGITLDKSLLFTLKDSGETFTLTPIIEPKNATNKDVKWTSSNPDITTVDSKGKVTFHAAGIAEIIATTHDGEYEAFCEVEVTEELSVYIDLLITHADGSGTVDDPKKLDPTIQLGVPNVKEGSMLNEYSGWNSLLADIAEHPGVYFDIDLSGCSMPSDVFYLQGWPGDSCINSIILPDTAKEIQGENAGTFSSLTSVSGESVETIGAGAFVGLYTSLTTAKFPKATTIEKEAFSYCEGLTDIDLPEVTTIGTSAFTYCGSLTTANFPNATYVGECAFQYCPSLSSMNFPAVTKIGNYAFASCTDLTTVTLSANLTEIGIFAFSYCTNLTTITCYAQTAPTLMQGVFEGVSAESATVYVPHGSSGYSETWPFGSIVERPE